MGDSLSIQLITSALEQETHTVIGPSYTTHQDRKTPLLGGTEVAEDENLNKKKTIVMHRK